jgi:hypothetical protein
MGSRDLAGRATPDPDDRADHQPQSFVAAGEELSRLGM